MSEYTFIHDSIICRVKENHSNPLRCPSDDSLNTDLNETKKLHLSSCGNRDTLPTLSTAGIEHWTNRKEAGRLLHLANSDRMFVTVLEKCHGNMMKGLYGMVGV